MFHAKTYRLLGLEPRPSREAIERLLLAEKSLQVSLPESLREWYSLPNAVEILDQHSSPDPAYSPNEFELDPFRIDEFVPDAFSTEAPDNRRLLRFKAENQGVCYWSLLLDGSDDPPVYVDIDGDRVVRQTERFSDHVYSCIWDYMRIFKVPFTLRADLNPISNHVLGLLREHFAEDLTTYGWPGDIQQRFHRRGAAIAIHTWQISNWYIGAIDAEALADVLRLIWAWDNVGEALYDCSSSYLGQQILDQVAKEKH